MRRPKLELKIAQRFHKGNLRVGGYISFSPNRSCIFSEAVIAIAANP